MLWFKDIMAIRFNTVDSAIPVADYISGVIDNQLQSGKRVLWLVAGGSAIQVVLLVSKLLNGNTSLDKLTVTLTDERYGKAGHTDSNWQQLKEAGFQLPGAHLIPILQNESLEATGQIFTDKLHELFQNTDYRLGLFGIGPDGHTAGILPGSPSVTDTELAAAYYDDNYPGEEIPGVMRGISRITIASSAIARLDEAIVYAMGEAKWPQLKRLADTIDIADQPAQALKQVPMLTIFTDYKEEGL